MYDTTLLQRTRNRAGNLNIKGQAYSIYGDIPRRQVRQDEIDWALDCIAANEMRSWIGQLDDDGNDICTQRLEAMARILVDSGIRTTNPLVELAICQYMKDQRNLVDATGACQGLCDERNLCQLRGQTVCRRTNEPCPWNNDYTNAVIRLFDWNGVIDWKRRKICPIKK